MDYGIRIDHIKIGFFQVETRDVLYAFSLLTLMTTFDVGIIFSLHQCTERNYLAKGHTAIC